MGSCVVYVYSGSLLLYVQGNDRRPVFLCLRFLRILWADLLVCFAVCVAVVLQLLAP